MAQKTSTNCSTDDSSNYFEAETAGFCDDHCEIGDTRQDGTRLRIEITNLLPSTYYLYVTLESSVGDLEHHPEFVICRPIYDRGGETVDFDVWHDSKKTNVTDTVNVEIQYNRTWRTCNGNLSNKTATLQSTNLALDPEFEYI